mgnify:CR=1 FL=1
MNDAFNTVAFCVAEDLRRDDEGRVDDAEPTTDATFADVAGFAAHEGAQNLVGQYLVALVRLVARKDGRVEPEFTLAHLFGQLTAPEHHHWDHRRTDPLHHKVRQKICIGSSLDFEQLFSELVIEEVVATPFLLGLEHVAAWVGDGELDDIIDGCFGPSVFF